MTEWTVAIVLGPCHHQQLQPQRQRHYTSIDSVPLEEMAQLGRRALYTIDCRPWVTMPYGPMAEEERRREGDERWSTKGIALAEAAGDSSGSPCEVSMCGDARGQARRLGRWALRAVGCVGGVP
jgi:hypothetical protein